MEEELITIGFDKGEADFGVRGDIVDLPIEKLKELREMIVVAIYVAENMWRKHNEVKAQTNLPPTEDGK